MRRLLRWLAYAICLLLLIVIGAVAFLQTSPGKHLLAGQLTKHLSTPESGIEIAGVEGWLPLDMQVTTLRLSDRDGVWLQADGVTVDWSPSALFGGRAHVDEIGAERIEFIRPPLGSETLKPESDEPFRLPEMPTSLPPITVERLAVPEIILGESLLGEAATFGLAGSIRANDAGDQLAATLDLKRIDQATAFAKLDAVVDLDPQSLDLSLNVEESGGMIAALAGQPDLEKITISLEGDGPLDDWSGRLDAEAQGLAVAEADLTLALIDQPRVTIDASLQPAAGALPSEIADLIGERFEIALDVIQTKAQALTLEKAALSTALASLDAEGSVDFDQGGLTLSAALAVPDLTPLSPLTDVTLAGAADAGFTIGGTLDAPKGQLALDLSGPAFDNMRASAVNTTIDWNMVVPLSSERPTFDLKLAGGVTGLAIPGAVLPDPDITWQGAVKAPLEGPIDIERFAIETAGSTLSAKGGIDPKSLDGAVDLVLETPSLKRLAEPYGQPIDGKGAIEAAIRLAERAEDIAIDLDADMADLAGLPPGASELLGDKARLQASARLDPSRTITVDGLTIDGAHVGLKGETRLHLDDKTLGGQLKAALPDLTVLGALIPEGTKGAIDLKLDLGGTLDAPSADIALVTEDLALAGEPITTLAINASGQDLIAEPNGKLAIDLTARDTPSKLALDYRLQGSTLSLDLIDLTAPETAIGGQLSIALDSALIDGALQGRIGDLAALQALTEQPLSGGLDLSATLAPDGDRQNADVSLQARDLAGDFGLIKTLDLDGSLLDIKAEPGIKAKATITGVEQGDNTVDALVLNAEGDVRNLDIALDVIGEVIKPLELSAEGNLALEDGLGLDLRTLNGVFAGEPLRLAQPLAFRQRDDDIQLSGLDLQLGDARLRGDVSIDDDEASGTLDLRSLPLSWSEIFGGPALDGEIGADIDLDGTASSPEIRAALTVEDLLAKDVGDDLALDLSLNASLGEGRLDADLEGRGLTRKPIVANASLPARLAFQPFTFDMPEDGKIEGKIDAEILLARLADILALDDQTMTGTLFADIDIGGTLGAPEVEGPVTLRDGGYENGATGTDIRDLTMTAIASSERIEITELSGKTGRKRGTLSAGGWLDVDPEQKFPLSLGLSLDDARLMNRDDIDGRVSGEIAMVGNLGDATIQGELTVNRAEISIPEGGGPNLPEIEVTERGGNFVNPPADEEPVDEEKPFDPALDLHISLPNKIFLRGRGLDSEWEGDLRITGRASEPVIVGDLGIKKGHFDFLDKRFTLRLGEITFSGSTPPNPIIALEAVAEDDGFTAIIKLNGPANDPQLRLESEPVLPEDEVLARLLFNRELSEIGPVEAGKLALAVNRLRGGGGFDAFGEIRNILKIDTLDVVSDEEGETAVKAGKYLNDDVYIEVEKGSGEEGGRARIEIELLPNIALEAETSENADSGVGIKWKFDY